MQLGPIRLTRPVIVRAIADALLVQAALVAAYMARFMILGLMGTNGLRDIADVFMGSYLRSFWFVGLTALLAFAASGFYAGGKAYRSRYKSLVVLQAITFTYAAFAGVAFLVANWFQTPRGIIPLGWVCTVITVGGARMFSYTWTRVLKREGRLEDRRELDEIKIDQILVIGGAGYIGSALLPRLLQRGYRVRLLDLLMFGTDPIQGCVDDPNLEIVRADFRQIDRIVEAMRGIDAVIHLGGIVGDPACALDEDLTVDVNLTATRVIAEVARGEGVQRFIFASTCSVYGSGDELLTEESERAPLSLYARTKLASERVLLDMADTRFAPVILRFGTIFGFSGRTRFDLVVNLLTAKAVQEGKITIFGGDQWRPFVHVDDTAAAVYLALTAPLSKVREEVFNVGSSDQNYTITQVGELIQDLIPKSEIVGMGGDVDKRNYRVDFTKIQDALGFRAAWTVTDGIRQVEAAVRGGSIQDYTDARFSNVKTLTEDDNSKLFKPQHDWPLHLLADTPGNGKTADEDAPPPVVPKPAQSG